MTLLSEDSQVVQDAFGSTKSTQITSLNQFLFGIIMGYVYSWKLTLIITAFIPFAIIIIKYISRLVDKHVGLKFIYLAESMTIAEETIAAVRTVRGFNRENQELKRFMKHVKLTRNEDRTIGLYLNIIYAVVVTILWMLVVAVIYLGGTYVQNGLLKAGDLISVYGFLFFAGWGIIELQASIQGEQKAIASGGRILDLTNHIPSISLEGGGKIIENYKGKVEFKNVSLKYPTRNVYVLKNVSFIINPGQMGALVGHSGSGKSTCVQLLERYYDVESGEILLDDFNIQDLNLDWLHEKIALVSQEPSLFQMSIKDNIRYGMPKASMEQVELAAETANAKKFIMKFENKYSQMVGEKGSTLSGGQRQRIAIARAVIKDPTILITDEATSALDGESEKKVQLALEKVMEGRTAVVVAHRLSTIKNAKVIYVFDSGEIKEVGTHDELLTKKGYYYELVKRQLSEKEFPNKEKNVDDDSDDENSENDDLSEKDDSDDENSENDDLSEKDDSDDDDD